MVIFFAFGLWVEKLICTAFFHLHISRLVLYFGYVFIQATVKEDTLVYEP